MPTGRWYVHDWRAECPPTIAKHSAGSSTGSSMMSFAEWRNWYRQQHWEETRWWSQQDWQDAYQSWQIQQQEDYSNWTNHIYNDSWAATSASSWRSDASAADWQAQYHHHDDAETNSLWQRQSYLQAEREWLRRQTWESRAEWSTRLNWWYRQDPAYRRSWLSHHRDWWRWRQQNILWNYWHDARWRSSWPKPYYAQRLFPHNPSRWQWPWWRGCGRDLDYAWRNYRHRNWYHLSAGSKTGDDEQDCTSD